MKKSDIDMIEYLLDQNEVFYSKGLIGLDEYDENSMCLIERMEKMLSKLEKMKIKSLLIDEFTLPKFRLSMQTLKAVAN
ncbi:hypothetical protein [Chryseobacterium indoltheticum]|uniref:Uncharacterized protein n=1 Tax=Chryseobacterium indoltheticum TaxID=254 RepID=A0A3G6N320_9FLAO|nr:hypothetical protein [Chryseobacterium indoltheticum]AZA60828.1 hypothetical protein EG340_07130 [Chryseobacterium indoltheticum]